VRPYSHQLTQPHSLQRTRESHSGSLRNTQHDLFTLLVEAETGQRGYSITEGQGFLEPYEFSSENGVSTMFQELRQLTLDNLIVSRPA
jgi:CHASE3 domain sensor protein